MQWSPKKLEVLRFERDLVVAAGAGCGKTTLLVELYLRLLAGETSLPRPLSLEEIVAITFTDKAALEMKERVRKAISRKIQTNDQRVDWETISRGLSRAKISTFHSFCSILLRENPVEAGIDPGFTLLDEYGSEAELETCFDQLIREEVRRDSSDLRILLRHFSLNGYGRGRGLRQHLTALLKKRAGTDPDGNHLVRQSAFWSSQAVNSFADLHKDLQRLIPELSRILQGKPAQFHQRVSELALGCASELPPIDDPQTYIRLQRMRACLGGNWGKEKEIKEQFLAIIDPMLEATEQIRSEPVTNALTTLLLRFENLYQTGKRRQGTLDFDDLQLKALLLLQRHPSIRDTLRKQLLVVMVDEFQDTNELQKELIELITGPEQRLFVVGDPKQSIYLFRGADVTVFNRTKELVFSRGGTTIPLQDSFRSHPGIIEFVNTLFSRIMIAGGADYELIYTPDDHLSANRTGDGSHSVELLSTAADGNSKEKREAEAAAIADIIQQMVTGTRHIKVDRRQGEQVTRELPRYGDIALLFRRFTHLKVFEEALRQRGVPYYVVKGKGFYHCQEIRDLLNILSYIEFSGEEVSLAAVLRSPLCGISDNTLYLLGSTGKGLTGWRQYFRACEPIPLPEIWEQITPADRERLQCFSSLVTRLRNNKDRITLAEMLEEILSATHFIAILLGTYQGKQKVANIRKLVEFSRNYSERGAGNLRSFVAYLSNLVEKEPTEAEAVISAEEDDVVRLMTIHQSKGLEFPVVFVPEIGSGTPNDQGTIVDDGMGGIGLRLNRGSGGEPSIAWSTSSELKQKKEQAELKRLLYVALTRARDHLILSGEGRGPWRQWIDDLMSTGPSHLIVPVEIVPQIVHQQPETSSMHATTTRSAALARVFQYRQPLPSSMVFSPTSLEDYATCPRKYYYKAVLGLDEGLFANLLADRLRRNNSKQTLSPLEQGTLAHALLEQLDFTQSPNEQRKLCKQISWQLLQEGSAEPTEVINAVLAFAGSAIGKTLAKMRLRREAPFIARFRGSADFHITGAIDLIAEDDHRLIVYDYKYVEPGTNLDGYRFQLATYMLALSDSYPHRKVEGSLVFLRGGHQEPVIFNREFFRGQLLFLMEEIRLHQHELDFGTIEGCNGSSCPFYSRCISQPGKTAKKAAKVSLAITP